MATVCTYHVYQYALLSSLLFNTINLLLGQLLQVSSLRFYYQPWRIFPHVLHVMYTPACVKRKRIHRQLELKSDKQL